MVLAKDIVDIALPQVTVIDACSNCQRALRVCGNLELITNQRRTARLDRIVIGNGVDRCDLVIVDEDAARIDGTVGETVRPLVERAIRL